MDQSEHTPLTATSSANSVLGRRQSFHCLAIVGSLVVLVTGGFLAYHRHSSPSTTATSDDDAADKDWWLPYLGDYTMPFTCTDDGPDESLQRLFDTAMMEMYGFDYVEAHGTAQIAVQQGGGRGAAVDCPMVYWLLAMSQAPFINHPRLSDDVYKSAAVAANEAVQAAAEPREVSLTTKEKGLIHTIGLRFNAPSAANQVESYKAYSKALADLHVQLPNDLDVMAFYADSIMVIHCNEHGYQFYQDDNKTPLPGVDTAIAVLEDCLERSRHALCAHLYIHITEPSQTPNRAQDAADVLAADFGATSQSQAQHLQHMSSHTYLRIGRYHDAVTANTVAHASDEAYLRHGHFPYGPAHDTAFLIHAAQASGEKTTAYDYANRLREHYSTYPYQPDYPGAELGWHIWRTVRLRFGDFDQVLADSDETPSPDWPYTTLLGEYAKGIAWLVAQEPPNLGEAQGRLDALQATLPTVGASFEDLGRLANLTLSSAVAYWRGDSETALALIRAAREEQEGSPYSEPPPWHMTVAQCEANLLRVLGQTEAAAAMFRHDLVRIPENRFSLYGLWQTLVQEGSDDKSQIESVHQRWQAASQWADAPEEPPLVCPFLGQ